VTSNPHHRLEVPMNTTGQARTRTPVIPLAVARELKEAVVAAFLTTGEVEHAYGECIHGRIDRAAYASVVAAGDVATRAVWQTIDALTDFSALPPVPPAVALCSLPRIEDRAGERSVRFQARFDSTCSACEEQIEAGGDVAWSDGEVVHDTCAQAAGVEVFDR
jgi:hypothetical protein